MNKPNAFFLKKLDNFIKNKEINLKKSIYITFNDVNVHLYYRETINDDKYNSLSNKNITIGFITFNGNFYESRNNMKKNIISSNILH